MFTLNWATDNLPCAHLTLPDGKRIRSVLWVDLETGEGERVELDSSGKIVVKDGDISRIPFKHPGIKLEWVGE